MDRRPALLYPVLAVAVHSLAWLVVFGTLLFVMPLFVLIAAVGAVVLPYLRLIDDLALARALP